ncbi:4-hydroxy-3-methylbut-2-enyl diphosphate reductase [Fibrobacterota bacterium]
MKIYLAKTAGFCEGVQKAVNRTIEIISVRSSSKGIYTYGPLIHNPQTLAMLRDKGVRILHQVGSTDEGEVIIRTHGVSPREYRELKDTFARVHNLTCPKVARVQAAIKSYVKHGSRVIIIGDREHAEVKALLGFSMGKGEVIETAAEAETAELEEGSLVVSQTTFNLEKFREILEVLKERCSDLVINNTICESTQNRQGEVEELCGFVDAMIVVGGSGSANTRRLVSICRAKGINVHHIESPSEVKDLELTGCRKVGVTAGASTPRWLINHTLEEIESRDTSSFFGMVRRLAKFLVYSYLTLSVAAAALSYVFTTYMEIPRDFHFAAIAFLYVYALHNINTYLLQKVEAGSYKQEFRFLGEHKTWVIGTVSLSLAGAILLSFGTGPAGFAVVAVSILLGILFNVELFSGWLLQKISVKSLRDIPGSKDIFTPLGWSTVIVLVPAFSGVPTGSLLQVSISFLITGALIFLRSTLLHLLDIEEDRIVGRDTIPTYLGEKTTIRIATYTISFFILALFILSWLEIGWPGAFLFSINTIAVLILIRLFRKKIIRRYHFFALALDSNLILSAGVAFLGKILFN